ncbi:hypothetical protein GIB67_006448 [Kingdonia uniflora]|uniref:GRAM domain-containing protein n=1 Tax=Kingdonia uniflora TaxID=39325 RepID=A0A7J7NFB0_9MAGN|nr:hypothetical protein GIB67_006448 [Kingdonia uniflora]
MEQNVDQFEAKKKPEETSQLHSPDYASYPKIDLEDVDPEGTFVMGGPQLELQSQSDPSKANKSASSTPKSVTWSADLTRESSNSATTMPNESKPYVSSAAPASSSSSVKNTMNSVRDVLGKWGKKVGETSKKAEDLAGNMWQHCVVTSSLKQKASEEANEAKKIKRQKMIMLTSSYKSVKTGPSFADAAMGRIAQGTKVLAEGGYDKIFRQTFESVPEEQLQNSYACYLSTSAGPVMGILYLSTDKLAFCSDNPLSYKASEQEEWSYYKVILTSCFSFDEYVILAPKIEVAH